MFWLEQVWIIHLGNDLAASAPLRDQPILNVVQFHGRGARFVVVSNVIDPSTYWKAPHQLGIEGLQQFGCRPPIVHARIKPQIVAVWIKDDWHAVVDG